MKDKVTCVFVHGWAMNRAIWQECIKQLPSWIEVVLVDLPGHGTMSKVKAQTLDDYVRPLASLLKLSLQGKNVIWLGWSLGGLAVLELARRYPQVRQAVLIATNPCFVKNTTWSAGVDATIFEQFSKDLVRDEKKTLRRFLALQVKGLPNAMQLSKQIQQAITQQGVASKQGLALGLKLLLETDFRESLPQIPAQLHWILGEKDSLVPSVLAQKLNHDFAQKNVTLYPNASHAPFVSHLNDFVCQIIRIAQMQRTIQK